jgi:hypothetical protein
MQVLPTAIKFSTLGLLSLIWLALHQQVMQLDSRLVYHVAAYNRDKRKAEFYFRSVWVGLVAAFISLGGQEAIGQITFDSTITREIMLSIMRGLGLWGLLVVAMVWVRIGLRASQPNLDGESLTPYEEEKKPRE